MTKVEREAREHTAIVDHLQCQGEDWYLLRHRKISGRFIPDPKPHAYCYVSGVQRHVFIWLN